MSSGSNESRGYHLCEDMLIVELLKNGRPCKMKGKG